MGLVEWVVVFSRAEFHVCEPVDETRMEECIGLVLCVMMNNRVV